MKIALFTDTYHPQINGVVSFLDSIMPKLAQENEIVLFAPGDVSRIEVVQKSRNTRIYWVPASPFPYYEGYRMTGVMVHEIEKALRKEKADIVHVHAPVLLGLQGLLMAKRLGIPAVATYHTHFPDYLPYLLDGKFPGFLHPIGRRTVKGLIRFVFSMADKSTAPTEEMARELRDYGVKNVTVLPNGVDLERLKPDRKAELEFMDRYDIPKDRKIILYVGRMGFEKRLEILLVALLKLDSRDWCLVAVGGGPQMESYMQEADMLEPGQAVFTGFVRNEMLNAAYGCADIFVSPSDSETFGLTFVEAMAFGLPAIGVDKLGPKEIIKDGKNGFLVHSGDSAAMAARIGQLLGDGKLRARMGEEARKTAGEHSISRSAGMTLGIYEELIERKRNK